MATITSTVFVTLGNDPYTLASGSEITVTTPSNPGLFPPITTVTETDSDTPGNQYFQAGEAIYTSLNGALITNFGTIIDSAAQQISDEYGVQSKSQADSTLDNHGLISAPNMTYAVGFNNGTIINEAGSTITGVGAIKFGSGTNSGTIINAGTLIGTGGTAIQLGNAANSKLILDPGQVLKGKVTASGSGDVLYLASGATTGILSNPANYHGFSQISIASGADWQIGTSAIAVSLSGISTIANFGTVNILGSITGTTLDLEGNNAHTEVLFNGASSGNPIYNKVADFGATDSIVLTNFNLNPGAGEQIVYNYFNGVLSVSANGQTNRLTEQFSLSGPGGVNFGNSTGIASSGVPTGAFTFTTLSNGSLVITVNTGSPYVFNGAADSNFNNASNYLGGFAPGYTLTSNETVSIVSGTASISSPTLSNNGTILVTGTHATLISTGSVGGTGTIDIASGGHVTLGSNAPVTNEISFGTGGTSVNPNLLDLSASGSANTQLGSVANFGAFDTIIVSGFTPIAGDGFVTFYNTTTGVLSITEYNFGTSHGDENFFATITGPGPGTLNGGNFLFSEGPGGLVISDQPCFAAGTRILTPNGEVAVEDIKAGDTVLTVRNGQEASPEVIWTGQRTIDLARHAMPEKVRPIRILAGAFGEGLPQRDLRLSPDHALYIDGHLIEAKTLVNGVTVIVEQNTRHVTYHHIELASHDVVLAEGLPAETYLESGNRMMFESDAQPMVLHPDFVAQCRAAACAPLAVEGAVVTAARQRLLERAYALGFSVTNSLDLVVKAGVERIAPESDPEGMLLFVLPPAAKEVQLLSGAGVPAETAADPRDRRSLGVAVSGLTLVAGGRRLPIALDDTAHEGFHDMEDGHRWTTGAARIALPAHSGRAVLEVAINGQAARWSTRRMG